MYKGTIIEESLSDKSPLKKLNITSQRIEKVAKEHETPWLKKWTLDTVEIPEADIEIIAHELSQAIDRTHCENWYCDFKNANWHYIIFYNKIFKLNRQSPADYKIMQEYAKSIGLPEHQTPTIYGVDKQELERTKN